MSKTPSIREVVEFGLDRIPSDRTATVPVKELVRLFKILEELNAFFHQPMHYPDIAALTAFLGSRTDEGAYELISEGYYKVLPHLLPSDIMQSIEAGELEHPVPAAYRAPIADTDISDVKLAPAQLGFSVADGQSVDVLFVDGDLLLRFTDWREQSVEHRFVEALAFRWSAQGTVKAPRDDQTYEVLGSSWLVDECRLEGYSTPETFVHHLLCFNASKVLEVISRRANL